MSQTYDAVARFSQLSTLLFFMAFFLGVLLYVFWPANRQKFDDAARQPLRTDAEKADAGGRDVHSS